MKQLVIGHLYPTQMNIYGDNGNVMALTWRLNKQGFKPKVVKINPGDALPSELDILIGGGGQDSGQLKIMEDFQQRGKELKSRVKDGTVVLAICGTYQLMGHYFETSDGIRLDGIGIFDAFTVGGDKRLIGNIVISSPFGRLVGFENHSGQTQLADDQLPLGRVSKGYGNDQSSGKEGAVTYNAFGSYLHGPLLPKNPALADELIRRAVERRYGRIDLAPVDDTIALKAAEIASRRP